MAIAGPKNTWKLKTEWYKSAHWTGVKEPKLGYYFKTLITMQLFFFLNWKELSSKLNAYQGIIPFCYL